MIAPSPAQQGLLVLEDGSVYEGTIVSPGTRFGEVVFNTSMTGYQEILTDPSYRGQIVVMTQPHIGNYGTSAEIEESRRPWVEAFIAHQFTARHSGSGEASLPPYLREHGIPALHEIDTRSLVRRLRDRGALRGVVTSERSDVAGLLEEVRHSPKMEGRALVDEVTCAARHTLEPPGEAVCRLAVYDYGIKTNILRSLYARGAALEVLPARTPAAMVLDLGVDGVVLSNGPGDPEPLREIVDVVAELVASDLPVLGICLGHQLLGLALGGRTRKLKFGHHGGNQPVKDLASGLVVITSQNHGFAVDPDSLPSGVRVTEVNLNDGTVEGLAVEGRTVFSVQYHPEAAPGPHDAAPLFGRFLERVAPLRAAASR
ncbi:MAG TPA: glutamine-hydrolyzing carbamoyl-phosphate synthase small subunit [Thermoanaerobaculia bacterium]|nr:glutamine-hydrolyzing carbamoyl-phosphate synthase small subunit [Thermoanaerobaculia bacterium]